MVQTRTTSFLCHDFASIKEGECLVSRDVCATGAVDLAFIATESRAVCPAEGPCACLVVVARSVVGVSIWRDLEPHLLTGVL